MSKTTLRDLLYHPDVPLDPAGGELEFLEHPFNAKDCLEVAMVIQHRFVFAYWLRWCDKLRKKNNLAPELVSLDWHNDVGGACDYPQELLDKYSLDTESDRAFFCWAGMRSNNDGNIWLPVYLEYFQAAHVILKDEDHLEDDPEENQQTVKTKTGDERMIYFYSSPEEFLKKQYYNYGPLILDIDLDYFAVGEIMWEQQMDLKEIDEVLSKEGAFIGELMPFITGISIALEPSYCGGFANAAAAFSRCCSAMLGREVREHSGT